MEEAYSDVWTLDLERVGKLRSGEEQEESLWERVAAEGEGPEKVSHHAGAVVEGRVYVYGGLISNENVANSLYSFDPAYSSWKHHVTKVAFN